VNRIEPVSRFFPASRDPKRRESRRWQPCPGFAGARRRPGSQSGHRTLPRDGNVAAVAQAIERNDSVACVEDPGGQRQ
jgi:hypothetical protein